MWVFTRQGGFDKNMLQGSSVFGADPYEKLKVRIYRRLLYQLLPILFLICLSNFVELPAHMTGIL